MKLSELKPKISRKKRKRVGRGESSGAGKTSGKGHKGQKARSGGKPRIGFEGGQMPLMRRLPKRGFKNILAKDYQIVNLSSLAKFKKEEEITPKVLKEKRLISKENSPVKILGNGEIKQSLTISAQAFSKTAKEKIEKAGGKTNIIK